MAQRYTHIPVVLGTGRPPGQWCLRALPVPLELSRTHGLSPVTRCKYLGCPGLPSSLPQRLHCSWLSWKEGLSFGIYAMDSVWTQLREYFCGPVRQDKSRWRLVTKSLIVTCSLTIFTKSVDRMWDHVLTQETLSNLSLEL